MAGIVDFYYPQEKQLSSYKKELSKHIYGTNHKINIFDKIIGLIVDLGQKEETGNDTSSKIITYLQNTLLMIIIENMKRKEKNQIVTPLKETCAYRTR